MPCRRWRILLRRLHGRMHLAFNHSRLRYHGLRHEQRCQNRNRMHSDMRRWLLGDYSSGHMLYRWR